MRSKVASYASDSDIQRACSKGDDIANLQQDLEITKRLGAAARDERNEAKNFALPDGEGAGSFFGRRVRVSEGWLWRCGAEFSWYCSCHGMPQRIFFSTCLASVLVACMRLCMRLPRVVCLPCLFRRGRSTIIIVIITAATAVKDWDCWNNRDCWKWKRCQ